MACSGECPEFAAGNDEFYWLMGLLDGIQAIINDIAEQLLSLR
jgi:hypothetical protein